MKELMYQVKTGHKSSQIFLSVLWKSDDAAQGRTAGHLFWSGVLINMDNLVNKQIPNYIIYSSLFWSSIDFLFTSFGIFIHCGLYILICKALLPPNSTVITVNFQILKSNLPNCLAKTLLIPTIFKLISIDI